MIDWSETHQAIRAAFRRFVETEVQPHVEALEHGDQPPYEILRKMAATFGLADMARMRFASDLAKAERHGAGEGAERKKRDAPSEEAGNAAAMQIIPIMELCRVSPGMVTALGVSMGLTAGAIMAKGTRAQKERWALPLLTLEKIGAWAITEPTCSRAARRSSPTGPTPTPSSSSASWTKATIPRSARC
jgi:alkylation response protein AidB-like acyl-CoA dehydrogenase